MYKYENEIVRAKTETAMILEEILNTKVTLDIDLLKPTISEDIVYNFTSSMTTAGSIIFLIDAKRQLAVFKLFDAVYQGDYALASLIASVITVIVLLVEGLAFLITRKGENRRVSRT